MGNAVRRVLGTVTSEIKSYNIEQRAHKVISQDKIRPVPKFESTLKDLEKVMKEHPEVVEETAKKNPELDSRLKQVFVTSSHVIDQRRMINPDRPLPRNTKPVEDFELGFKEEKIENVPPGKVTLRQAIDFLSYHKVDPEVWTAEKIALEFKLKLDDVKNILEHFKMLAIYVPEKGDEKKRILLRTDHETRNFEQYMKILKENSSDKGLSLQHKIRQGKDA